MQTTLLLVHGAWQGEWAWQPVVKEFSKTQFNVVTFDLPGSGSDHTPLSEVTLDRYAQAIIDKASQIKNSEPNGKVVLVGHSMGGAAITAAATKAPELFNKLIYLCAFLPQPEQSVAELAQESKRFGTTGPVTLFDANLGTLTLVPESIRDTFFNDSNPGSTLEWERLFRPQAVCPLATPLGYSPRFAALNKAYIVCHQDRAIDPKLQMTMAKEAGIEQIEHLDAGHEPFFSCTAELSQLLIKLAN